MSSIYMTDLKRATAISKTDELYKYLNPKTAQKKAMEYLGNEAIIYKSNRQSKKYMIVNPLTKKFVHFGTMKPAMEDYTKHTDDERRSRYRARAENIRGQWREDPYSPNNLSIHILW